MSNLSSNFSSNYLLPNEPVRFVPAEMERVLTHCSQFNASDITFQTNETVYAEIYGQLHRITQRRLNNTEVGDLLNAIYGPNGTAQILSGHDVDTYFEFRPNRYERYRFRVNGTGCQVEGHEGLQLTLRSIPTTPPPLDDLDLEPAILDNYAPKEGVVYVTGATGSGKSTLLASMIRSLVENAESNRKVLTYESPIEFVYDAIDKPTSIVSQTEIPRHLDSFSAGVRNALRRKPGLILVGEARDSETMSAVLEAALTGHPVYTTLHTNGVAETIRRLVTSFPVGERQGRTIDIIETLRMVIWQKLVPTVDGKRVALREFLVFDEKVRDQLLQSDLDRITDRTRALLKQYGQPMLDDAEKKFKAGLISQRTFDVLRHGSLRADLDAKDP
jgi:defect-in-organelle-trafficking protein DotB